MLAGQDNHRLCKHLQAYGTNQLFLQVVHVIHFSRNIPGRNKTTQVKRQLKTTPVKMVGERPGALVLVGAVSFYPAGVTSVFSSQSAVTSKVAIFALTIFETEQGSTEQLPSNRSIGLNAAFRGDCVSLQHVLHLNFCVLAMIKSNMQYMF